MIYNESDMHCLKRSINPITIAATKYTINLIKLEENIFAILYDWRHFEPRSIKTNVSYYGIC